MKKSKPRRAAAPCDSEKVAAFDYAALAKLSKPARRALLNNGIATPAALAKRKKSEVAAFHGIGPSAFPILAAALRGKRLFFKPESA